MKVFQVDYNIDGENVIAVVEGESPGDAWINILKYYKGRDGMMIFIRGIHEKKGPIYLIGSYGSNQ